MKNPSIGVIEPTSSAFARMQKILFQPFDIGKWFILGFSAWLATMFDGGGSNGGSNFGGSGNNQDPATSDTGHEDLKTTIFEWLATAKDWIYDHPGITAAICLGVILLLTILVVLFWVSCRGKFMLLDNVVWDRALISQPWKDFKCQGNSLFRWSLIYSAVVLTLLLIMVTCTAFFIYSVVDNGGGWAASNILAVVFLGGIILSFMLVLYYIAIALEDFVIPIMYRKNITTTEAWGHFLKIQNQYLFKIILFALWKCLLYLAVGIAVFVLAFATCCIGLILMSIPYIGAVLLLPITVFMRCLGPEFLAQLGEEYNLFPPETEAMTE